MTLFSQFDNALNTEVMSRLAVYVGETTEKTDKAVQGLLYTVIGGLLRRTTTEIGVNQLFTQIQRGQYTGQITNNLATILKDPTQTHALLTAGNDATSHLLPALKSSIGTMISTYASIRNSSAISLLGIITAVVLDVLGRQVVEKKLDADGLAVSLFDEREAFVNAVPEVLLPQLIEKLNLQSIVAGVAAPARRPTVTPQPAAAGRVVAPPVSYEPLDETDAATGSLAKWFVGGLLLLGVLGGGYYIYQNTRSHTDTANDVSDVTSSPTDTSKTDTVARSLAVPREATTRTTAPSAQTTLAGTAGRADSAGVNSVMSAKLDLYLSNPVAPKGRTFPLPTVKFQPGTVILAPGSEVAINDLANLLKTHPTIQIRLVGYANDAVGGLTNKSLSFKRVNMVKQQLVNAGVNFIRVDAVGLGTGVFIRPGDTTAVRKPAMRKIDMKIVTK